MYELLCCLRQVTADPDKRAEHSLTLVTGMQAGEPIDEWLLVELLAMAGIDLEEPDDRRAATRWMAALTGAGLLSVSWDRRSRLRHSARDRAALLKGERSRDRHRGRLEDQMRMVEEGIRRAMEVLEDSDDEG